MGRYDTSNTLYCRLDGPEAIIFLADLFSSGTIQGEIAEQYVSSINRAYDLLDVTAAGRPAGSKELYFEIRSALKGFVRRRLKEEGISFTSITPTTRTFIVEICSVALGALDKSDLQ